MKKKKNWKVFALRGSSWRFQVVNFQLKIACKVLITFKILNELDDVFLLTMEIYKKLSWILPIRARTKIVGNTKTTLGNEC